MTDYRETEAPEGADVDPQAERIVLEIEETRMEMGSTIDEIGNRLQPQTIANDAREKIREATVGKVERIVDDAGQTAQQTGTTIMDTIRQNPVPAALAAIGVGWLFMKMRDQQSTNGWSSRNSGNYGYDYGYTPRYSGGYIGRSMGESYNEDPSERARRMAGQATDRVQEVGANVQQAAQSAVSDTQQKFEQAQWQARSALEDAQGQFDRTLNENPLAIGALALGVGAAIGLALPSTQKEREIMGEPRDRLVQQAAQVATQALDQTQQKAQEVGQQMQTSS